MIKLTQERIENLLEFNSGEVDGSAANAEAWEVHELARIALASLEADGDWVACSERMPDEYDFDMWVFSPSIGVQDGVQWDGFEFADDEYQFRIKDASHWMKKVYPAAPQQEVK